ncbi:molybdopterin-guanine dinucleotide biosynthesis protein B [candidate division WOR-3 bacterium]|nr:molybdopterin-guanine dinucleotide biosynthesis protein B [candidate division WOR-3 bacterium]
MKCFSFVGYSNSGKTTLIIEIAKKLRDMNYKIAIIKHSDNYIKREVLKDTTRFLNAGIDSVSFLGKDGFINYHIESNYDISELLLYYEDMDYVLIEGGKNIKGIKKIWIGNVDDDINREEIVAVVKGENTKWKIPLLNIKDVSKLVSYLLSL